MVKYLIAIQCELKAPKSNFNTFGNYKYRSAEDILTAVKPLLQKYGCQMTIRDDVVAVGDRIYIKAIVTIVDEDGNEEIVTAFAREDAQKKGMDGSQITGTASSYARKYALNGLFLIDDTKDADTDEYQKQIGNKKDQDERLELHTQIIGAEKAKALEAELSAKSVPVDTIYRQYGVDRLADLTEEQHSHIINRLVRSSGNNRKN